MPAVRVEFFGIPRHRAGAECADFEASTLGELLELAAGRFPSLSGECISANGIAPGYICCINGRQFVTDPATRLQESDAVQILSADAGG